MTKEELENLGIVYLESKFSPNKFYVPLVEEVNIYNCMMLSIVTGTV